ncbi:metallopeptidase family protein [Candidatus Saccharibacteria bacterium]|nr:metallopeptidase family protein [Candidatus Saccharibacteria bacterium]
MDIHDEQFASMIARAMDEMPRRYMEHLDNVAITYADAPTPEQVRKLKLRGDQLLLGLYEGVPLPQRGAGYNLVLPDKITLFKLPILAVTHDVVNLYAQVKHTLWHEIAHYYGLDHDQIHAIEARWRS